MVYRRILNNIQENFVDISRYKFVIFAYFDLKFGGDFNVGGKHITTVSTSQQMNKTT